MNAIFGFLLQGTGALILTASAQSPAAVVEEIQGSVPGVQFMDYVDPGQVIRLGAHDRIVLGYLKSCWRESISGGTVTVGTEQSEVAGGEVTRAKVACEGGKMMLSAELAGKSGAMVFRQAPKPQAAALPHPEFTLYGLSPVFEVRPPGKLVVERLDQPGERHEIAVTEAQLTRGAFLDFAKSGVVLAPGGIYRAKLADREIVFKIDPGAKPGDAPLVGRLARLQARH
ncbi:MAG TPA: hypothetical protein VGH47_11665 [Xanthobacteraceae bacterium]|jgi:hypothetical protein